MDLNIQNPFSSQVLIYKKICTRIQLKQFLLPVNVSCVVNTNNDNQNYQILKLKD